MKGKWKWKESEERRKTKKTKKKWKKLKYVNLQSEDITSLPCANKMNSLQLYNWLSDTCIYGKSGVSSGPVRNQTDTFKYTMNI